MIKTALATLMAILFAMPAMADHPAVGYWFVEVSRLTNEAKRAGGLAKIDQSKLDEMALCHGHFNGTCDLWIHARTVQVRIKAEDDGITIDYSIVLSWPQVKEQPKESQGRLDVGNDMVAKDGWEKEKFVLVLKRLNLKQ